MSRFAKHLVLIIVHPVYKDVKHVVFILNAKRNVVNHVYHAKRLVYRIKRRNRFSTQRVKLDIDSDEKDKTFVSLNVIFAFT
jgi:hypothetical protein